jgi:hypothetical protein
MNDATQSIGYGYNNNKVILSARSRDCPRDSVTIQHDVYLRAKLYHSDV